MSNYVLCGKRGCKCAQVYEHRDGGVTINDDYGGSVRLTKDELGVLVKKNK
jgi:hypothetical protein